MPFVRVSFGPVCWSIARYLEAYARSFGLERSGAPKGFHPQVRWEDEGKTSWATVFSCMKTHIQPPMWANVETNWAEVRLDPMSLAFIAQVDIFLYFLFFSIFLPFIYIFFHLWAVKGVEGGNNPWWSQDFNLYPSQVNFISKCDVCRPECSPYSFKKVLFCRVVKSNHTVLSVFFQ